jgi:hypothetical protein
VRALLILLTSFVGQTILAEASLSYLGLGVQEPVPGRGLMLQRGAEEYASTEPWIAIFPGLAIATTVFGFSLFGDALRDALDRKLRDGNVKGKGKESASSRTVDGKLGGDRYPGTYCGGVDGGRREAWYPAL